MIYDPSAQNDDPAYQAIRKRVYSQVTQPDADPDAVAPTAPETSMVSPDFVKEPAAPSTSTSPRVTAMGAPEVTPTETPRVTAPTAPAPPAYLAPLPADVSPASLPGVSAAAAPAAQTVDDAVMQNYQQLGATPTGPGSGPTDSAYFIRRINETGGMTPDNINYWFGQNGRIARELRGEVPPEAAAAETPQNVAGLTSARSVAPPLSTIDSAPQGLNGWGLNGSPVDTVLPPAIGQAVPQQGKPKNSTSGSNHRPGDGTGIPGVYDWNNAGYPVDAMGAPYMGSLQGGEPNPWTTGGGDEGFPIDSGPATPGGGTPAAPKEDTYQEKVRKMIAERMAALGLPVDENATGISAATSAIRDETRRAGEQERKDLAERLYAEGGGGLDTGALGQQIARSGERVATATAGTRANMVLQEYGRRQEELDKYYAMAMASGDAEEARKIQMAMGCLMSVVMMLFPCWY